MDEYSPALPEPVPELPPRDPIFTGIDVVVIILFTLLALLLVMVVGGVLWTAASGGVPMQGPPGVAFLLAAQTAAFALGFGFAAYWIRRAHRTNSFLEAVRLRPVRPGMVPLLFAAGALTSLAVAGLSQLLPIPRQLPIDQLFGPGTAWPLAFYGVLVAPFFEEFFFRGLIFPALSAAFREGMRRSELGPWRHVTRAVAALVALVAAWRMIVNARAGSPGYMGPNPIGDPFVAAWLLLALISLIFPVIPTEIAAAAVNWVRRFGSPDAAAIVVTGTLFGLMHGVQLGFAWAAVLLLSLVGMVLTWLRARTGTFAASWLFHSAYNFTLFAVLYANSRGFHDFSRLT